jgi:type I restriction enzyme, S subunit
VSWSTPPLGSLVETIVPARDKPTELTGPIPWVRSEDFGGKWLEGSQSGQGVTPATVREMPLRVFPTGTVVCSCSCDMGRTAITTRPLITNQTYIGLVPRPGLIDAEFLYYSLQGHGSRLNAMATGAIQSYLSRDDFRGLRLPIPDLKTQRSVVDFLDIESARIDALLASKQRLVQLLDQRWESLLETEIRDVVSTHGEAPLRHLAKMGVGIVITPAKWYADAGIPALRGTNVKPGRLDASDLVYLTEEGHLDNHRSRLHSGDIVVVRTGAAGSACVVPPEFEGANCIDLLIVRSSPHFVPQFAEFVLNSAWTQRQIAQHSVGSIQSHFNMSALKEVRMPAAPISEQRRVVDRLQATARQHLALHTRLTEQLALLREHRQALIAAAVTGELEVPGVAG